MTSSSSILHRSQAQSCVNRQQLSVDVGIVGGGIVGLTLAAALRNSGLTVAVVEAQSPQQAASRQRAYAFSPTSADIFKGLGLWDEVGPSITPFAQVCMSDGDYPGIVTFQPQDLSLDAVYYAAEHHVLMSALQQAIAEASDIHCLSSARVVEIQRRPNRVSLNVETREGPKVVTAALLVGADGMRSPLRQQAQISTIGWKYWQSCITTTLKPEYSHHNIAYERFWASGPFAILPLPGNRCQIVWTAPHAEAEALLALPREEFLGQLQRRYGHQMGRLEVLSEPLLFSVRLMQSRRYVQSRLALVGDAAHCCHPVGGQGLNMGIRDAVALAEVLIAAHQRGDDLGSLSVLRRYERWRRLENWIILSFTDLLNRCFSNQLPPLVAFRRLGFRAMQHIGILRRFALRLMTGRLGRMPKLARVGSPPAATKFSAAVGQSPSE